MKERYRNIFLFIGIISIVLMCQMPEMQVEKLHAAWNQAPECLLQIIGLWGVIYLINAVAWYAIMGDGKREKRISYLRVLKLTISGYALNYATPLGLMGGEPYRILELSQYVGAQKASSSVILYSMMHIFSHFLFWIFSMLLYLLCMPFSVGMSLFFVLFGGICLLAVYTFMRGYKKGFIHGVVKKASSMPFVKKWAGPFYNKQANTLRQIDTQIAALHCQHKRTFYFSLSMEFMARLLGCVEIFLILRLFSESTPFSYSIYIVAFTSLFSNLFFFTPMQLGIREGGFAMSTNSLTIPVSSGIYTSLFTRIREVTWIVIGLLLMKIGNRHRSTTK